LEEIQSIHIIIWPPFSKEEFKSAINKCNILSTPGPDFISWKYFKGVVENKKCLNNIVDITNMCIDLGHWPIHVKTIHIKTSLSIIISKPNKIAYNLPKMFRPIILLNTLGKLIKKVIGERLQFQSISKNFIHPNQLSSLKQHSTRDTGIFLTYLVHSGWAKNLQTSTLAFNIAQFFPSLNHLLLPNILDKAKFDTKVSCLFFNYLISKKTQYLWNNFISSLFSADIDVGQESVLSSIFFIFFSFFISLKKE